MEIIKSSSRYPRLEEIVNNSKEPMFVADKEGTILSVNPASCDILGIPLEELVGFNVKDLMDRGYWDKSSVMEAIHKKEDIMEVICTRQGRKFISKSYPLFDENGDIEMILTTSYEMNFIDRLIHTMQKDGPTVKKSGKNRDFYDQSPDDEYVVAESSIMKKLLALADNVAHSDSTIMLYGESGTGKEVLAKYIHRHSKRNNKPLITINCAAIPENLFESELFGYEKGAFTGAGNKGKPGLFELADKGTIFLDEIAEFPIYLQPKLLRLLESGELRRVGGTEAREVNVRIIGATNRDLCQMIKENQFREDLYYRLDVIPLTIPPLRERKEDITALAELFLEKYNLKYNSHKFFGQEVIDAFVNYEWPGNARELRNMVERLYITTNEEKIDDLHIGLFEQFDDKNTAKSDGIETPPKYQGTLKEVMEQVENKYIEQVLEECNGVINEAAKKLGIHRTVLYRKRKQGIVANKHLVGLKQHGM